MLRRLWSRRLGWLVSIALLLVPAVPAHAEWGYWSTSGCRPDVSWYGVSTLGIYYQTAAWGTHIVRSDFPNNVPRPPSFLAKYTTYGRECGFLGAPVNDVAYQGSGWYAQGFEGGQLWVSGLGDWVVCSWQSCWYG